MRFCSLTTTTPPPKMRFCSLTTTTPYPQNEILLTDHHHPPLNDGSTVMHELLRNHFVSKSQWPRSPNTCIFTHFGQLSALVQEHRFYNNIKYTIWLYHVSTSASVQLGCQKWTFAHFWPPWPLRYFYHVNFGEDQASASGPNRVSKTRCQIMYFCHFGKYAINLHGFSFRNVK